MNTINLSILEEFADGDNEFMVDILSVYAGETPNAIDKIKAYTSEADWESLRKVVHKLKSSVAMLGMEELSSTIAVMEANIKGNENLDTLPSLSEKVIVTCEVSLPEVMEQIEKLS